MNGIQKVIKYCAMAFAAFLSVTILGAIVSVVMAVTTGIAGVNFLLDGGKERVTMVKEYSLEEAKNLGITSILVDCDAEITVKQGAKLTIEAKNVTDDYEIRQTKGTFRVVQKTSNYGINLGFIDTSKTETVTVTIPEELSVESVKVNSGSGKVKVSDVTTKSLKIDSGSGKVTLERIEAEETGLNTGSGGILVDDAKLGKLGMESGSGSVTMKDVEAEKVTVDSGSGSVLVEGTLTGKCEFDTGSGSVTLRLDGREEEYLIKADCGSGGLYINGKKKENGNYGTNTEGTLVIDSGSGSVKVEFVTP